MGVAVAWSEAVPIPHQLKPRLREPEFWRAYFFQNEVPTSALDRETYRVEFPLTRGMGIALDLSSCLSYHSLNIIHPALQSSVEIAWDDQAHWHPHVLRWEELELIARCAALQDEDFRHPGLTHVFLHRFAPVCLGDDVAGIFPMLEAAMRTVDVLDDELIEDRLESVDARQGEFEWKEMDDEGWWLFQNELAQDRSGIMAYTLRHRDNSEFPFAVWNDLINAARRYYEEESRIAWCAVHTDDISATAQPFLRDGDLGAGPRLADLLGRIGCPNRIMIDALCSPRSPAELCWIVEWVLGLGIGECIRTYFGSAGRPQRTRFEFSVQIPTFSREQRHQRQDARRFVDGLNAALSVGRLGNAIISGIGMSRSWFGKLTAERAILSVFVRDDLERGVSVIRQTLAALGAPKGTTITLSAPERREYEYTAGT